MTPTCPTCAAAFRGGIRCGRCGTDLTRLTAVLRAAHARREEARVALGAGDGTRALERALEARRLHDVAAARRLHVLALLATDRPREAVRLAATLPPAQAR